MELSKDKRETGIAITLRVIYLAISIALFPLFRYTGIKQVILLTILLLLYLIIVYLVKWSERYAPYINTLIFFLPLSISINHIDTYSIHTISLVLLILPVAIIRILNSEPIKLRKEVVLFSIFLFLFMNAILIFVYYAPIRAEYQTHINPLPIIVKSSYLLATLYLIYINMKLANMYRHLTVSAPFKFLSIHSITLFFSLIFITLTLMDIISTREEAERILQRISDNTSQQDVLKISSKMKIKGLHQQNIDFLNKYIESFISRKDRSAINLISSAESMYPYECSFAEQRIRYYRAISDTEDLNRYINNLPAPVRRGCKLSGENGI
jgi:hypothetical protein